MYGSISVRAVRDKFETDGNQRPTKIYNWVQLKYSWRRCRLRQILKISTEKPIIWVKMNLPSSFSPKFLCLFQIFYTLTYFFSHLSLHMRRTLPQDQRPGTSADVPDVPSRTSVLASYASVGMKMLLPCKPSLIQAYFHIALPSCILCIFIQSFFHFFKSITFLCARPWERHKNVFRI